MTGSSFFLVVEIDRGVEKRRGGGDNNSVSTNLGLGALNELNGLGEVSLPNVTAVNDTNRKNLLLSKSLDSSIELLGDTNKVVVETSNGETLDGINVRAGITEVRGDQKLGETGLSGEELVGSLEGSLELPQEGQEQGRAHQSGQTGHRQQQAWQESQRRRGGAWQVIRSRSRESLSALLRKR